MNLQLTGLRRSLSALSALLGTVAVATPAGAQVVTASLNIGTAPYAIAVNASTNKIYVTDTALSAVEAVNGATNAVVSIPVGSLPQAIAVNPVTNTIYVANTGGLLGQNTLTVINGSSNATATLNLGAGSLQPDSIAINPATNTVYVATFAGPIAVINGATNAITTVNAAPGTNPVAIAIDVSLNQIYVACTPSSVLLPATATLTVINGASNATTTVAAGAGLFDVELNASAGHLFLGSVLGNALTELSATTNSILGSVTAGAPKCIAVDPNTGIVYYVNGLLGNIVAYSPTSGVSTSIGLASSPLAGHGSIAIDATHNKVYVATALGISAIDGATNAATSVPTGLASSAITLNPTTGQVYVADALGQLTVVDPLTTHLAVSATGPATIGSPITVTVTAEDAAGATVSGYVGTVHISSSDLLANLQANKMLTNGTASFSVTLNSSGSSTISAGDVLAASIKGTSLAIAVEAAGAPTPTPTPTPTSVPVTITTGGGTGSSSTPTPTPTPTSVSVTVTTSTDGGTSTTSTTTSSTPITTAPVAHALAASQQVPDGGVLVLNAVADGADSYQWYFNGVALVNGGNVSGANTSTLMIINLTSANAGGFSYTATNSQGTTTSAAETIAISTATNIGRLINISCRSEVGTGGNILIAGFIIGGNDTSGTEPVLIRASGPALTEFGVTGVLPDPELALYQDSQLLASDSRWADDVSINATATAVGAFQWTDAGSQDSALLQSLPIGDYTAQVTGQSQDTGVALVEVYDATPAGSFTTTSPRLTNISARVRIGSGNGMLIAGFVVGGSTSCTVMVRATGPGMAAFGITDYLPDPQLQLFSGSTMIASNQGWDASSQITWASTTVGAFPWTGKAADAAVIVTLPPGAYTAQVSGISGDAGVALVEVYEVN